MDKIIAELHKTLQRQLEYYGIEAESVADLEIWFQIESTLTQVRRDAYNEGVKDSNKVVESYAPVSHHNETYITAKNISEAIKQLLTPAEDKPYGKVFGSKEIYDAILESPLPDVCVNSNNTDTETAQRNDTKEPKECVWKCIDVTNDEYETGCSRNEDYPNPNMQYCGFCGLPIKVEG